MTIRTILSAALIMTAFLPGCSGAEEPARLHVPEGSIVGDIGLTDTSIVIRDTAYAAEKGYLIVPENRDDANTRLIAIPILRYTSTGSAPSEPIFYLAGGPGNSNMGYTRVEPFIGNHDIVLVGYRGVDGTVVLDCPEVDAFFGDVEGDLLDQATVDALAEAYASCADRLQREGVDTDGYNIMEVLHDLDQARISLGYERINLLSGSYGTRLAMLYDWVYPEKVHRTAMIAVNPPGHFEWFPEKVDEQIQYYSDLCAQDPECSSRTENLAELIRVTAQDIPESWWFFPIKRGNVLMGTFIMMYHTDTAKDIFDAWIAASEGDWSGLALISMAMDMMTEGASVWGESAAKAMSSDYIFEPGTDLMSMFMPEESIIGAPASILGIAGVKGWPVKHIPDSLRRVRYSEVEALLLSGSIDVSTPAEYARDELMPFLPNGKQIILKEFGHTADVWGKQRPATHAILASFFRTGEADESLYTYAPMDFDAGMGFTGIMKLGVAAMLTLVIIIGLVAWFVVRKFRSRKGGLAQTAS